MAKKTLKRKAPSKAASGKLSTPVVDSVRDVWFAGLGAFSIAQQEGEKLIGEGGKLFDKLVSEGTKLEEKSRQLATKAVDGIKGDVESTLGTLRQKTSENLDRFGDTFDVQVAQALERLGVPTSKELHKLSGNVNKLSRQTVKNLKDLDEVFETRVSAILQDLRVPAAEDLHKLSDDVQQVSQKMAREAAANLGKLENVVEARVSSTLRDLGVPTVDDTNRLAANLRKLSQQVNALQKELQPDTENVRGTPETKKAATVKSTAASK